MLKSNCCPICVKPSGGTKNPTGVAHYNENGTPLDLNNTERVKLQKRFCKLFQRYLAISEVTQKGSDEETKNQLEFLLQEITKFGIVTCEDCLKVMESFCDIYNEIKKMELLLNWKVWTLKNIMECGQGDLQGYAEKLDGDETRANEFIETFKLLKTSIIEKCSHKMAHSFPRLTIPKLNSDEEKSFKDISKTSRGRKCTRGTNSSTIKYSNPLPLSEGDMPLPIRSSGVRSQKQNERITKKKGRNRLVDACGSTTKTFKANDPLDTNILMDTSLDGTANQDYNDRPDALEVSDEEADFQNIVNKDGKASLSPTIGLIRKAGTSMINVGDNCTKINHASPQISTELIPPPIIGLTENSSQSDISSRMHITKLEVFEEIETIPKTEVDLEAPNDEVDIFDVGAEHNDSQVSTSPPGNITEGTGKRLRTRHFCSKCNMAFTSSEKLLSHQKNHDCSVRYDQSSLVPPSPEINSDDDAGTMSWTSSSSSDGDDDDVDYSFISDMDDIEPETSQEIQDLKPTITQPVSKSEVNKIPNKISSKLPSSAVKSTRANQKRTKVKTKSTKQKSKPTASQSQQMEPEIRKLYKHIHFKCPDCSSLHPDMRSILIHRKESKSCSSGYDPKTSIKVEILAPKNMKTKFDLTSNSTVFALIDLPQEIVTCKICSLDLYSAEDLKEHEKLHGTFKCNFCDAEFSSATGVAHHELTHDTDNKTTHLKQCPRCDLKFNTELYIRHHLKSHLNLILNEPTCAICKTNSIYVSQSKVRFLEHLKRWHDLSAVTESKHIYRCTESDCPAHFLAKCQLKEHLLHRHNINAVRTSVRKVLYCKDCDQRFSLPAHLRRHRLRKHVKSDEIIPCSIKDCASVFETQMELKMHLKNHEFTSAKTPCQKCGKAIPFISMTNHLKEHERMDKIESGELHPPDKLSFVCEQCGKKFRLSAALKLHYLSHTGPDGWEFSCDICSKKCATKQKLEEHLRTHSQDKPFTCKICGVKYAHRHNLRIHVNNKHGDKVQDIARKVVRVNVPTSKKGVKRKRVEESSTDTPDDSESE